MRAVEIRLRSGQDSCRRRGGAPALEVIKVMFCSREDVPATRTTRRNSCGVTHKPPSHPPTPTPPQPIADCGKSLAVTLLSLSPRRCERGTVDDQFQMRALCGGRRHMVQNDLRANTSASPVPPSLLATPRPPRANRKTRTYINFPRCGCLKIFR